MLDLLIKRHPALAACRGDIEAAMRAVIDTYRAGGKLLIAGNGGSAADSEHIVGELMKGFLLRRELSSEQKSRLRERFPLDERITDGLQEALPAISLCGHPSLTSAFCNDVDPALTFSQQLYALAREGDLFLGITTSGNSQNVCLAAELARAMGLTVLSLTGEKGGRIAELSDVCVRVPETETYKVQELHLPVYHFLCAAAEAEFFGK